MARNCMILPPKMAAQYAQMAKEGKYDEMIGKGSSACYIFHKKPGVRPNEVTLVSVDPPIGHCS